jgi:hypothetical protein
MEVTCPLPLGSIHPGPFQHSGPPCLQYAYFFDVITKVINVAINHAHPLCLTLFLGRTLLGFIIGLGLNVVYNYYYCLIPGQIISIVTFSLKINFSSLKMSTSATFSLVTFPFSTS